MGRLTIQSLPFQLFLARLRLLSHRLKNGLMFSWSLKRRLIMGIVAGQKSKVLNIERVLLYDRRKIYRTQ